MDVSTIICPVCKKEHTSKKQYCEHCGGDLAGLILHYKQKNLPIVFNNIEKKNRKSIGEILEKTTFIVSLIAIGIITIIIPRTNYFELWLFIFLGILVAMTIGSSTLMARRRIIRKGGKFDFFDCCGEICC